MKRYPERGELRVTHTGPSIPGYLNGDAIGGGYGFIEPASLFKYRKSMPGTFIETQGIGRFVESSTEFPFPPRFSPRRRFDL